MGTLFTQPLPLSYPAVEQCGPGGWRRPGSQQALRGGKVWDNGLLGAAAEGRLPAASGLELMTVCEHFIQHPCD